MSWRGLSLGLLLVVVTPGCFVSRNTVDRPLDPEAIEEIEAGRTDKEGVVGLLGAPTDIIFSNRAHDPLRVFAYEYTYSVTKTSGLTLIVVTFLNSDTKRDHVLVFFDEDGVVSAVGSRLDAEFASYGLPFGD